MTIRDLLLMGAPRPRGQRARPLRCDSALRAPEPAMSRASRMCRVPIRPPRQSLRFLQLLGVALCSTTFEPVSPCSADPEPAEPALHVGDSRIHGRIVDPDGKGIQGGRVNAFRRQGLTIGSLDSLPGSRRGLVPCSGGTEGDEAESASDAQGEFDLSGLSRGEYVLRVSAPGWSTSVVRGATAVPSDGPEQVIALARPFSVRGHVVGLEGEVSSSAVVWAGVCQEFRHLLLSNSQGTVNMAGSFEVADLPTVVGEGKLLGVNLRVDVPARGWSIVTLCPWRFAGVHEISVLGAGALQGTVKDEHGSGGS